VRQAIPPHQTGYFGLFILPCSSAFVKILTSYGTAQLSYSCASFATVGVKNNRRNASAKMPQEINMVLGNENFSRTSVFDFKIRGILISGFVK
jgi:hypothetical protein